MIPAIPVDSRRHQNEIRFHSFRGVGGARRKSCAVIPGLGLVSISPQMSPPSQKARATASTLAPSPVSPTGAVRRKSFALVENKVQYILAAPSYNHALLSSSLTRSDRWRARRRGWQTRRRRGARDGATPTFPSRSTRPRLLKILRR